MNKNNMNHNMMIIKAKTKTNQLNMMLTSKKKNIRVGKIINKLMMNSKINHQMEKKIQKKKMSLMNLKLKQMKSKKLNKVVMVIKMTIVNNLVRMKRELKIEMGLNKTTKVSRVVKKKVQILKLMYMEKRMMKKVKKKIQRNTVQKRK